MSFKMPSTEQVRQLDDSLGIDVTDSYADSVICFIKAFADGYRHIESLADVVPGINIGGADIIDRKAKRTDTARGS